MASGIDIATVESAGVSAPSSATVADQTTPVPLSAARASHGLGPKTGLRPRAGERRWPVSPLTRRILAVNVLALALLAGGFLYLGKYQASLIGTQIESLKTQGEVFAAALGEGAVLDSVDEGEILLPDLARQMMRRLVEPTRTRARLFDVKGDIIADSRILRGPGDTVQVLELQAPERQGAVLRIADRLYDWIVNLLPRHGNYPLYRESALPRAGDYPEVIRALRGETGSAIRSDPSTAGLVFSVAIPIQRYKQVLGVVMLSTGSSEIEEELRTVRLELLRIFGVALLVTVLLSFYLAGTIARPIRRLAAAAERARGRRARVEIPDFTRRGDEIGDLSGSLREMTDELWQRISAIESFAADVAHELKNPLTSLRSAVETLPLAKTEDSRNRLLAVIQHDVKRLDRLISDISDASRLDAEMQRQEAQPVDLTKLLTTVVSVSNERQDDQVSVKLTLEDARPDAFIVLGHDSRLGQVIDNLIDNARSFSAPGGSVRVFCRRLKNWIEITVEDDGPGVPLESMERIFERFYTHRPDQDFGQNSGLGLSISKQIVEAHDGRIWVENRQAVPVAGEPDKVVGARFLVRLPAME